MKRRGGYHRLGPELIGSSVSFVWGKGEKGYFGASGKFLPLWISLYIYVLKVGTSVGAFLGGSQIDYRGPVDPLNPGHYRSCVLGSILDSSM